MAPSFSRAATAAAVLAAVSSLASPAFAAVAEHEVTTLPGWDEALPSRVFAGRVDAGKDGDMQMYEHYMFLESENDPATDPVVVWTNGGPGASSLFGLFVELGPFLLSEESIKTEAFKKTGVPSLFYNKYGWTRFANILVLNSPPPVGFSYCDPVGPKGNGESCGPWTDERTARHNRIFLENWIKAFPEYGSHDWFITGESYAGVYVPTLVRELLDNAESFPLDKLRGFAVGDGCVGTEVNCVNDGSMMGPYWSVEFLRGHGQISKKLYDEVHSTCSEHELRKGIKDAKCKAVVDKMNHAAGGFFEYNLYDECWYDTDFAPPSQAPTTRAVSAATGGLRTVRIPADSPQRLGSSGRRLAALNDYPCGGSRVMGQWLALPVVRKALHVGVDDTFFTGDNGVGFNYTMTERNLMPFYQRAINHTPLRVLVYNGDTDPGLNSLMAEEWTSALGIPEKEPWSPWTLDGEEEMAGYVTRYANGFDFATIRGSGHMVPEYKPAAAYELLRRWIKGEDYPGYKKRTPPPKGGR